MIEDLGDLQDSSERGLGYGRPEERRSRDAEKWIAAGSCALATVLLFYGQETHSSTGNLPAELLGPVLGFLFNWVFYFGVGVLILWVVRKIRSAYLNKREESLEYEQMMGAIRESKLDGSTPGEREQGPAAMSTAHDGHRPNGTEKRLQQIDDLWHKGIISQLERDAQRRRVLGEL